MRKLAILGVVLVAVLVVVDLVAKRYVETGLERSVRSRVEGVGRIDASISSFPFIGRLLVPGEVDHIDLVLTDVLGRGLPVAELRMEIHGLMLDRDTLLSRSRVRITGVDEVQVTAVLARSDLAEALGLAALSLELIEGSTLDVAEGRVELPGGFHIDTPGTDLLPCDATVTVEDDAIRFRCESDRLPAIVIEAIGSIDLREQLASRVG